MNPDNLLSQVHDASNESEYRDVLSNIRQYNASVSGTSAGHDGRTPSNLLDEAEDLMDQGLGEAWNEQSANELLLEAVARISDAE